MGQVVQIGAFGIIPNENGAILLSLRRDLPLWNLPGGGMEAGETPWEAVVRETREETGLQVVVDRLHAINSKPNREVISFHFVCRVIGGSAQPTEEALEHRYFAPGELPELLSPHTRESLLAYFEGREPQMLRQVGPSTREWLAEREKHGSA